MPQISCTFRTIISHPFNDHKAERYALVERIYLRLKSLCAQPATHIQNFDLCWAVGKESDPDQQTTNMYLWEKFTLSKDQPTIKFIILHVRPLWLMSLTDPCPGG